MENAAVRRRVYTVSRLNQEIAEHLESGFGTLWVEGEISNLGRPASGHLYFSLKDSGAQIRCAMFRGRNRHLAFRAENGAAVLARGRLALYGPRGDVQVIVEHMELAGAGALQAAFERLRRELAARGWFDQAAKRALPPRPSAVGVVASPSGAALRDVLQVLARRAPQVRVVLYPTTTQGTAAARDIVAALARAGRRAETDVLLLVRGGGSLEDLQAFNDVAVARALRDCPLPVVAGVGHETDVTIADLVADLRAPTPSAAAELAVPDAAELASRLARAAHALLEAERRSRRRAAERLERLAERLAVRHPERALGERMQRLDELIERLGRAWTARDARRVGRLEALDTRLAAAQPGRAIDERCARLDALDLRLAAAARERLASSRSRLALAARALDAVSPLAVLERGYAVVRHDGRVLRDAAEVAVGARLDLRLARGRLDARVERVDDTPKRDPGPVLPRGRHRR